MERLMSDEERIRRAEELVRRRKNAEDELDVRNAKKYNKRSRRANIFFAQILACLLMYCTLYYLKNMPDYKEGKSVWIDKIKSSLNYDVDFKNIYLNFINWCKPKSNEVNEVDIEQPVEDENQNNEKSNEISNDEVLGIGGEYTEDASVEQEVVSEEDDDVNFIINDLKIINPLEDGVVTSRYGERESSNIVSANHKGIDLGAPTGSTIISASDGQVVYTSSKGDFGNHIKIQSGEYTFIYAHCNKLNVKEGEYIQKGQKIAEVGSTGRATGPHLHFEIRRGERTINPELIMNFEK